jgi:WD40-like Beta Propeller Repeat
MQRRMALVVACAVAGCADLPDSPAANGPLPASTGPADAGSDPGPATVPIVPMPQVWRRTPSTGQRTPLILPEGRGAALSGAWRERETLWEDAALVYARDGRQLCVLDGGSSEPRLIWSHPDERGSLLRNPAWSADGSALYLWMNLELQLCALDTRTAAIRSLTELDTHTWHYKGLQHLDPAPEFRTGGVIEDETNRRLLVLLDEESNEKVAFWQRRPGRGGSCLATVSLDDGSLQPLFDKAQMQRSVLDWDCSLQRGRLYAITSSLGVTEYVPARPHLLEERRLDGSIVRAFADPDGLAASIQLSPDQHRLLIERAYRPGFAIPPGGLDDLSREQVQSLVDNDHGGWVVLDVDTGDSIDGPRRGDEARWAPDGDRIVYVDDWAVALASLGESTITPVIEGGAEDWGLGTWIEPVWSPDSRRLAITGRVLDTTLLLDLEAREFMVIHEQVTEKIWALTAQPFAEAPASGAALVGDTR